MSKDLMVIRFEKNRARRELQQIVEIQRAKNIADELFGAVQEVSSAFCNVTVKGTQQIVLSGKEKMSGMLIEIEFNENKIHERLKEVKRITGELLSAICELDKELKHGIEKEIPGSIGADGDKIIESRDVL